MPLGLKKSRATYQHLVNFIFRSLIRKSMEVYVDDILVKSMKKIDHLQHLSEAFSILKHMKLNLAKCAFSVASDKFLGHVVTRRGIKANLEKIQTIINIR